MGATYSPREMIDRLVSFDTTSRDSNLGLIDFVADYLKGHGLKPLLVPNAKGTMQSATAAADPLDDPPGVWARLRGFLVGPGIMPANSHVTVLPRIIAPARRASATHAASPPA